MLKKLLCLTATIVLVSACQTTETNEGEGGTYGQQGYGQGQHGVSNAAPGTMQDMVVNVGDRIFFEFDRSDITSDARDTLDRQAVWLKKFGDVKIIVEGHTDERGTREYNLALGERRAMAARNYLVAAGIVPSRISTVSYGKERPAVAGSTESAWAQNRRSVTVVAQ